jgi:hypothetical protein
MILNNQHSINAKRAAEVLQVARDYIAAGVSVIPLRIDRPEKKKSPALPSWKEYQSRLATESELRSWFSTLRGIGLVTGVVSGGLEVIDFDQPECFEPWRHLTSGIVEKLPIVETGSGGFHAIYRCNEICGNTKIAKWELPEANSPSCIANAYRYCCNFEKIKDTRIETRGEGGYIVGIGSPREVHPSGNVYAQVLGPPLPDEIPIITPAERRALWLAAAEFDCGVFVSPKVERAKQELRQNLRGVKIPECNPSGALTPWDDFDRRASWRDILEPHDWVQLSDNRWRRPNKNDGGLSASIGKNDDGIYVLTVFSSNAGALSAPTNGTASWGPFRAYAALNHGGDGSAAAKAIAKLGYGSASRKAGAA